jgi:hypothetical protein
MEFAWNGPVHHGALAERDASGRLRKLGRSLTADPARYRWGIGSNQGWLYRELGLGVGLGCALGLGTAKKPIELT